MSGYTVTATAGVLVADLGLAQADVLRPWSVSSCALGPNRFREAHNFVGVSLEGASHATGYEDGPS